MPPMSAAESDDEFALNGPSTPNIPKKINPSTSKTRGTNNTRAEAGPSRAGNATASNKRKKGMIVASQEQSDDDEVQEVPVKRGNPGQNARGKRKQPQPVEEEEVVVMVDEDDEDNSANDVEVVNQPPVAKGRGGSKKPTTRAGTSGTNGHTKPATKVAVEITKSKGKQKAKPTPASKRSEPEAMDVDVEDDAVEDMDTDDLEREAAEAQARLAQAINKSGRSGRIRPEQRQNSPQSRKDAQIARLEKQLQQAQENIKDLQRQLDEFNQVRKTEPEQLLERMQAQHQSHADLQDNLLVELRAQIAKRDPQLKLGKNSAFELLTREEANREMQALQQKLKNSQDAARQQDERLKAQAKEIETLQDDKRSLDLQLKEEVRRTKELAARPPPTSSKSRTGAVFPSTQDPKISQVISFYEDLTNVIVPNMKSVPGRYLDSEEWILNCCYTHKDVVNPAEPSPKSCINFNLRLCFEPRPNAPEPITKKEELVESVHYTPLELQNESPEFVQSLGFLGDNFTFERDQLALFSRTLHDYVSGEGDDSKSDGNAASDDSVQLLE